jgi:N-acetylneuraminic acid mutarotase
MKKFTTIFMLAFILSAITSFGQAVQKKPITGTRDAGVCFSIGNKVYMGGGSGYKDFWEYTPATDSWEQKNDLPGVVQQRAFGIGLTVDGVAYVGLGSDSTGAKLKYDLWQYDAPNDSWIQKENYPGVSPDACAFFSANSKIYLVGGTDNVNVYGTVYEYNTLTNKWRVLTGSTYPDGPILFATGFSIGNYGYVTCGAGQSEFKSTYRFDPVDESWTPMADFLGTARQTAIAFVIGNLAYVGGGQKGYTQTYKDFYRYNPDNNTWASVGDIGTKGRAWGIATAANGKGYLGTGWDFGASFFNDWWEFTPQNITGVEGVANTTTTQYYDFENQQWFLYKTANEQSTITIKDISGKNVLTARFDETEKTVSTQILGSGIYFIEIESTTGIWREKFWVR